MALDVHSLAAAPKQPESSETGRFADWILWRFEFYLSPSSSQVGSTMSLSELFGLRCTHRVLYRSRSTSFGPSCLPYAVLLYEYRVVLVLRIAISTPVPEFGGAEDSSKYKGPESISLGPLTDEPLTQRCSNCSPRPSLGTGQQGEARSWARGTQIAIGVDRYACSRLQPNSSEPRERPPRCHARLRSWRQCPLDGFGTV